MGIFTEGINPAAYRGELTCPYVIVGPDGFQRDCGSKAIRFVENVSKYRLRYRCRKCGGCFQYDISNRNDLNPYAPYQGGKFWRDLQGMLQGRKLKGALK